MNLVLLFRDDFISENRVRLRGRRLKHVLEVHRAAVGDKLTVGLLNGAVGRGEIVGFDSEELEMEVQLLKQPPLPVDVSLILALPRPKVLRRVLFTASAMGVKRIWLMNSYRVEKSFWKSPLLGREKILEQIVLGLEQAKDTIMPEVLLKPLFRPFVEDELPGIIQDSLALVAHPGAEQPCPREVKQPVTLVIGPEGGLITYEIESLSSIGFVPVSLGERPLRVESVVPFLLSRLF
jgi:RsmE family RNA methyltransferase